MPSSHLLLDSPLGEDKLYLRSLHGADELSQPFVYELELLSRTPLQSEQLLGKTLTAKLAIANSATRYFHGHATELALKGKHGKYYQYHATLRPWLWLLTLTSNCRIFQQKSVPDIIKQVFRDRGFTDIEDNLSCTYSPREYAVQYRESDFAFVSRLMEEEGIYYFFQHEASKHSLVLADGPSAHKPVPGYADVPWTPETDAIRDSEYLDRWQFSKRVAPSGYALDDYDFTRPKAALVVKRRAPAPALQGDYERYDYPGGYVQTDQGENRVRVRMQEQQAGSERMQGAGVARGLGAGARFKLSKFPDTALNQEYVIVSGSYEIYAGEWESQPIDDAPEPFRCTLTAIRSETQFSPARLTPRPIVPGHQTAKVVGKSGEEIWTDEHARVKVQFPWDREGKSDEKSSCWIRVAQLWAGAGFGSMHVPRIGQEVLVSFLEGDPDRPIITGRVYNGTAKPPYPLPSKAAISGIKTESTPKGGGYNELSMDDTKGKEKLSLHAQRDMQTDVDNDYKLEVKKAASISAKTGSVECTESLELKVGQASIVLKNDQVELKLGATKIVLSATGIKLDGMQIDIKGQMIKQKAAMISIN